MLNLPKLRDSCAYVVLILRRLRRIVVVQRKFVSHESRGVNKQPSGPPRFLGTEEVLSLGAGSGAGYKDAASALEPLRKHGNDVNHGRAQDNGEKHGQDA